MKVCKIEGCNRIFHCKDYCKNHYEKFKRYGDPLFERKRKTCKICGDPAVGNELCNKHYQRQRIHGDPNKTLRNMSPPEFCKIDGCNKKHIANGYCNSHNLKYWSLEKRKIVINHYSNGTMKCFCCGESIFEFLDIDHIEGNGNKHREENHIHSGHDTIAWLIRNNFPPGFRVLCSNCNVGRYRNGGICPHKKNI